MSVYFVTLVSGHLEQQPDDVDLQMRGPIDLDDQYLISRSGPLMITPLGNYPIQASTTGNTRGTYATDWQHNRAADDQVASGQNSVICGGLNNKAAQYGAGIVAGSTNTALGYYSFVGAGYLNEASQSYAVIGGGYNNKVYAFYGMALGGLRNEIESAGYYSGIVTGNQNKITSQNSMIVSGFQNLINNDSGLGLYDVIGGGYQNDIDGCYYCIIGCGYQNQLSLTRYSVICGGASNDISGGYYSFIGAGDANAVTGQKASIVGGEQNEVAGNYGFIGGGKDNTVGGVCSHVPCGEGCDAKADYSKASGKLAGTTLYGEHAQASGAINDSLGANQTSVVVARGITTDDSWTKLYLDGSAQKMAMEPDTAWTIVATVNAFQRTGAKAAGWMIGRTYRRDGTGNIVQAIIAFPPWEAELGNDGGYDVRFVVDNTTKSVFIEAKGAASQTVYWTARVEIVQTRVDGLLLMEAEPMELP